MERERHLAAGRESRSTTKPSRRTLRIPTVSELGRENPFLVVFVPTFVFVFSCLYVFRFAFVFVPVPVCVIRKVFLFVSVFVILWFWSVLVFSSVFDLYFYLCPFLWSEQVRSRASSWFWQRPPFFFNTEYKSKLQGFWDCNRLFGIRNVEIWVKWGSIPAVFLGSEM